MSTLEQMKKLLMPTTQMHLEIDYQSKILKCHQQMQVKLSLVIERN